MGIFLVIYYGFSLTEFPTYLKLFEHKKEVNIKYAGKTTKNICLVIYLKLKYLKWTLINSLNGDLFNKNSPIEIHVLYINCSFEGRTIFAKSFTSAGFSHIAHVHRGTEAPRQSKVMRESTLGALRHQFQLLIELYPI